MAHRYQRSVIVAIVALFWLTCSPKDVANARARPPSSRTHGHAQTPPPLWNRETVYPSDAFDCPMRRLTYEYAASLNQQAFEHEADIADSLNLAECPSEPRATRQPPNIPSTPPDPTRPHPLWQLGVGSTNIKMMQQLVFYVDCSKGDNSGNGSITEPFRSLERARDAVREARTTQQPTADFAESAVVILVRAGICYLGDSRTLLLSGEDSNVMWAAFPGETVTLSGGSSLAGAGVVPIRDERISDAVRDSIVAYHLPSHIDASRIDQLFLDGERLVRARFPNGNSETDRMPHNYTKAGGQCCGQFPATSTNYSVRVNVTRNSTIYPWFGHSLDSRWVLDYHVGGNADAFSDGADFWEMERAAGMLINESTFSPRLHQWGSNVTDAIVHVIHYDWWGNWQFRLDSINMSTGQMLFAEGGWQDAHGGPVIHNYFFVENVLAELDTPGEWYVDAVARVLYLLPPSGAFKNSSRSVGARMDDLASRLTVSQLATVLAFVGSAEESHASAPFPTTVSNVSFVNFTITHTCTTFLSRYEVPSSGDWSIHRGGAVFLQDTDGIGLVGCSFTRLGGNGVCLSSNTHRSLIRGNNFEFIGDSAIISVGKTALADGVSMHAVPMDNVVAENHVRNVGVYGKQTAAYFQALTCRAQLFANVFYEGPRSGVNVNDGYCGGLNMTNNVLFNFVLESGDHGPFNSWDRSAYVQQTHAGDNGTSTITTVPQWNLIDRNLIVVGPKAGSLFGPGLGPCSNGIPEFWCPKNGGCLLTSLDHDDGSSYYLCKRNVLVYGGGKNYLGHNKVWDSNLMVFPSGPAWMNRTTVPCFWDSMWLPAPSPCAPENRTTAISGCDSHEVITNNTCLLCAPGGLPFEYDMCEVLNPKVGMRSVPYTARNDNFMWVPDSFSFQCPVSGATWNYTELQAHGIDLGGHLGPLPDTEKLSGLVRAALGIQQ